MVGDEPYQSQLPGGGNNVPDHYSRKIHNQYRNMRGLPPITKDEWEGNDPPVDPELERFINDL